MPLLLKATNRTQQVPLLDAFNHPEWRGACKTVCPDAVGWLLHSWARSGKCQTMMALFPADVWIAEDSTKYPANALCATCKGAIKARMDERRKEVFGELGGMFGLKGWKPQE